MHTKSLSVCLSCLSCIYNTCTPTHPHTYTDKNHKQKSQTLWFLCCSPRDTDRGLVTAAGTEVQLVLRACGPTCCSPLPVEQTRQWHSLVGPD
jgi:hypothetical protein